jgi:sortase B
MEGKRKGSALSNVVLVIAVVVFLFSAYKLISIYSEYHKGDKEYDNIVEEAIEIQSSKAEESEKEELQKPKVHTTLKVDFDKLNKINKDVIGWIQFDEPERINYPVVKGEDNDKYLTATFEGKKNSSGAIFMDANNSGEFADRNTFIYGHNMKNGSMFGQLRKFKTKDYYEQNPYFYIYTPDGKEVKYQIFSVCIVEDTSRSYTRFYNSDEEYLDYLKYIKSIARYDTGVEVTAESKIVSLSTCTNVSETQRLVVHGVKIGDTVIGE